MRLGLLDRAFQRRDLAADAIDGGLLGRDLGARGIDRDAVIAVVDPEDHVAGPHQRVVAGEDGRDVAGHPRAERGVVGAHIGVVGADEKTSDQKIMHAVGRGGEREQRADADQDHLFALAGFRRGRLRRNRGRDRWLGDGGFRHLGGAARGLFRKMRAKRFGQTRGSVARRLALGRIRLGSNDTRGLVSRYGHHGLLITNVATPTRPKQPLPHRPVSN